ncbi:DNA-3-methyladenine glycosylase 2 family protein [Pollutibacter soli]|uniref:DNA-3-methyladenine glycosylase family protein n=1 Tax=Pollutibacter soli TaxID=3034157 RepID=UPI0030136AF6
MLTQFSSKNFNQYCDRLAGVDPDLKKILEEYGYPPLWTRSNSFETLVHFILEQQVSLASALAALNKLKERFVEITPQNLLTLSDEEMKACYVSRQKIVYTRALANAVLEKKIDLVSFEQLPDEHVKQELVKLKGVGNWTADVYLMFVLRRTDIFPVGDLAAVNAFKQIKRLPSDTTRNDLLNLAEPWKPYRTIATMMLWHFYLSSRQKKIPEKEKLKKATSPLYITG